jgi:predicted phage terminase large subunit-like protein
MIAIVEALLRGSILRLALVLPPRHGKTELANILAPAFALGRNPREQIISASYGSELSEVWGRRTRNLLADPAYGAIFPQTKLSADSAAINRFETSLGGSYLACGRGGPITGRGASLLVLDDLIKDYQEGNSETICRSTIDWIQSTALTRLAPGARILAAGTRWSAKDPLAWLIEQPGWVVLHLPAISTGKDDPLGRSAGEALWPSRYPIGLLEEIRRDIGSRNFQTLYQGDVTAAQGAIFKRDWFRTYTVLPEKFIRIIQSWDCGFKTGHLNDYSVGITLGETSNGFYLLNLVRGKWEFPELLRVVKVQAEEWQPHEVLIEDRASGQSLVQELKNSTSFPVIPIKADRDKESRASAVTSYFESGRVFFPENAPWVADLQDELCAFPNGLHDDQTDALCQALNRLRGSADDLGLVSLFKGIASGIVKLVSPSKPNPAPVLAPTTAAQPGLCTSYTSTCSNPLPVIVAGGQARCASCGAQFWPNGANPHPFHPTTRKHLPIDRRLGG